SRLEIFLASALPRLRHLLLGADAGGVLVQFAARRLRDLPRLRTGHRRGFRPSGAERSENPARRRDPPLAVPQLQGMPGRPGQVREEAKNSAGYALQGFKRKTQGLGPGRRARMGELEEVLARRLVRRAALLQVAGEQGLQDAYPGAALEVPRLHALPELPRHAPQAGFDPLETGWDFH